MVPHVFCSLAAGTTFQLLLVGREGCRVVHDMCKAVQRKTSICSTLEAKRFRAHEEAGQRGRVRGVPRRSEPHSPSVTPAPDMVGWSTGGSVKTNRARNKRQGNPLPLLLPRDRGAQTQGTVGALSRSGRAPTQGLAFRHLTRYIFDTDVLDVAYCMLEIAPGFQNF